MHTVRPTVASPAQTTARFPSTLPTARHLAIRVGIFAVPSASSSRRPR